MNVRRFINSPVSSNSYIIQNGTSRKCIIIDPGSRDVTDFVSIIEKENLDPVGIVLTHEHFDHVWGANIIRVKYNARIACSKKCSEKISIPQNYFNLLYYNDSALFQIKNVDLIIDDTPCVDWLGLDFQFVKTPGHSSSSICVYVNGALFTGDTIMQGYNPVLKRRHEASIEELRNSVRAIFDTYPSDTIVYPGHGNVFCLGEVEDYYRNY